MSGLLYGRSDIPYFIYGGIVMNVVFSNRAYAAVMAETTEKIQTETGGLFLGAFERDTWYVIEAIDPGPKSVFEVAYFEYDQKYTQHLINKIANLYDQKLELIGLWHRHPGSFDVFSTTDNGTNSKYALMRQSGAISALVNIDPKFRLTMYHVGRPCKYRKISYVVGDDLIPEKYLKLKTTNQYEKMMYGTRVTEEKEELHKSISLKSFIELIAHKFMDREVKRSIDKPTENIEEIKNTLIDSVVADISFMSEEIGIEMSIVQNDGILALIQDTVDGVNKLFFVYDSNEDKTLFVYDGKTYIYEENLFENLYHIVVDEKKDENDNDEAEVKHDTSETRKIIDGVFRFMRFDRNGDD